MSMIKSTNNLHDLPEDYERLSPAEKTILLGWIDSNLLRIKSISKRSTSYGLKHFFESSKEGFYITNGMFKGAMLEAGFYTDNAEALNWNFNVSQKSIKQLYDLINKRK